MVDSHAGVRKPDLPGHRFSVTKPGPPIPISPVQLEVGEVMSWCRPYLGDIYSWVQNFEGAKRANLARVTLSAVRGK